jgi:ABC-type multidrug transport system fused ATPase/permease subunit
MGALRAIKLISILPIEVRDVLRESPKWVCLLLSIAGLVAFVEAVTLANLLFLGYAVVGQEPSGTVGGLLGERVFGGYSQRVLLILLSSVFIVLVTVRLALVLTYRYLSYKWSSGVVRKMQKEIMRRIISAPIHLFDERQLGGIVHDLINAPTGAIAAVENTTVLMSAIFLICAVAVMLILISPWLLLIAAVIAILWFVTIVPPLQKRMRHYQQQRYDQQAHGMNIATDTISGIREIRAVATEPRWIAEFSHMVDLWEATRGRIVLLGGLPAPALQAMLQTGFAAVTIFAALVLSPEDLVTQLPVLGVFAYGLFRAYPLMGQVSQAWIGMAQAVPNLRAAAVWTGLPEDPLAGGTQQVMHPIGVVRFDHLSFSYDSKEPTIVDAEFCIQAGKVTALVGASGAGKSTLIDLMLKFRAPNQGALWLGGQSLNDVVRRSWLDRVGLVRQDVFLFAGTIRENLLEYKSDATDEELRSACRRAGALEFIDAMSDGLDTRVGERGVTMSGGQRQRIAIARALLRNPDVLILDEAMSALDGETEAKILKALLVDSPRRIIVLISHRLATVRNADHIVVLDRGRVVEQGTHEELLERRGRYRELFSTQVWQESAALSKVRGS